MFFVEDTLPIDAGVNPEVWLNLESSKTQLNGAISGAVASGVHSQGMHIVLHTYFLNVFLRSILFGKSTKEV